MKHIFTLVFAFSLAVCLHAQTVLSGDITNNTTLLAVNRYLLDGTVFVKNNVTLTIEPGTVILGKKSSTRPALVITRGAKIVANGTFTKPIVFTSDQAAGQRNPGDWGGIIILGKAVVNTPTGEFAIEGLPSSTDATCGGNDDADNSGVLRYVRIEFPGIAFAPNIEINGLTMGAVGSGTIIDNVQVSYSGDDSFEWFGGTVNCKHLVAYKGLDDDFDTDYGYRGKIQYAVALRDPALADVSGSNGFESDNNAAGAYTPVRTQPVFANVTLVGPKATRTTTVSNNFKRAAHIRRASQLNVFNSILMAYPDGILMDGAKVCTAATGDSVKVKGVILACDTNLRTNVSSFNAANWFSTAAYNNTQITTQNNRADVMLTDPFNAAAPNWLPMAGSPALSGGVATTDPFFEATTFRGAFGTVNWTAEWTQFNPINYTNVGTKELEGMHTPLNIYPNPAQNQLNISFVGYKYSQTNIEITNVLGAAVYQQAVEVQAGKNTFEVSIAALNPGLYFVKIDGKVGRLVVR